MAYIFASEYVNETTVGTTLEVPVPAGHRENDVIAVFPTQDGGGTFSASSGWLSIFSSAQANHNGQRTWGFYKVASSDAEPPCVITSGISENMGAHIHVIRDCDTSNPIDVAVIVSASTRPAVAPSVTTLTPNALLLHGCGIDNQNVRFMTPLDYTHLVHGASGGAGCMAGFSYQDDAGATPTKDLRHWNGGNGSAWTVAFRDNGSNRRRGYMAQGPEVIRFFGEPGLDYDPTDTYEAPSAIAASIDGITCDTALPTMTNNTEQTVWTYAGPAATERWIGRVVVLASTVNLAGKVIGWDTGYMGSASTFHRHLMVFVDASGNWSAFECIPNVERRTLPVQPVHVFSTGRTRDFGSGTLDWSAIAKVAVLASVGSGAVNRSTACRNLLAVAPGRIQFIPGRGQRDWSMPADLYRCLVGDAAFGSPWMLLGGDALGMSRLPVQFGANGIDMDAGTIGSALECDRPYTPDKFRRHYMVADFEAVYRLRANSTDSVRLSSCLLSFPAPSVFEITADSSPSAEYDFTGLVLVGARVRNLAAGVDINDATLVSCYDVQATGGIIRCTVRDSLASSAVVAADPSVISGCAFVQSASGGHAIEITSPGTYTFSGNTFEGYGADGTTDAAIYNNSGGAVTLNISGGGDTPTVRNGAGASTTVSSSQVITLDNVVIGSSIRIELESDGSLVEFRVADDMTEVFTVPGSIDYRVKVRKGTSAPFYKPFETLVAASTGAQSIYVAQILDE